MRSFLGFHLRSLQTIHLPDQDEDSKCHDQEIENGIDEQSVVERWGTGRLCRKQAVEVAPGE